MQVVLDDNKASKKMEEARIYTVKVGPWHEDNSSLHGKNEFL